MKQFLYEDDASQFPPNPFGLPDGYGMFTSDGHLHVIRGGQFVDITPTPTTAVIIESGSQPLRQLAAADDGAIFEVSSSQPQDFEMPGDFAFQSPGSLPNFTIQIDQVGTGAVTITPANGVLINGTNAVRTLTGPYATVVLRRINSTNSAYHLTGQFT